MTANELGEEELEARVLESALEESAVSEIVHDLLPKATRIYAELKEGSDQQNLIGEFIMEARSYLEGNGSYEWDWRLRPDWVKENIYPIILKWEAIMDARQRDRETSQFLGSAGQAMMFEGTVTFTTSFEKEYGTGYLTLLKDDNGNQVKYWNVFHVTDPIQSEVQGQQVIRNSEKGDKVRFKATVKEHEIYKGVKGTVIQRARKVELIKAHE